MPGSPPERLFVVTDFRLAFRSPSGAQPEEAAVSNTD